MGKNYSGRFKRIYRDLVDKDFLVENGFQTKMKGRGNPRNWGKRVLVTDPNTGEQMMEDVVYRWDRSEKAYRRIWPESVD